MKPIKQYNWMQIASLVIILVLGVDVVLLTIQNNDLKSKLNSLVAPAVEPLKEGEHVGTFQVRTPSGDTTLFTYDGSSTGKYLLFVFSTSCPHCEKTLPICDSITSTPINSDRTIQIFGLCVSPHEQTMNYVGKKEITFIPLTVADTSFSMRYRIAGVPETILLRGDGTVAKAWIGELKPKQVQEIIRLAYQPVS